MFNRTLKRPMFRIGGQAGQGSGIMSHVEPRANKATGGRIMAAGGYNPIGIGNYFGYGADPRGTYFNPYQGTTGTSIPSSPINTATDIEALTGTGKQNLSNYERGAEWRRNLLNKLKIEQLRSGASTAGARTAGALGLGRLGILGPSAIAVAPFYGMANAAPLTGIEKQKQDEAEKLQQEYFGKARRDVMADVQAGRKTEAVPYKYAGIEGGRTGIDDLGQVGIKPDYYQGKEITPSPGPGQVNPDTGTKEPVTKEATTTSKPDKTETIKKEADYIRGLIDDPDLTKAEIALIVGKALATPGPIANKIQVASDLSLGLAKERGKTSRDITLRAYENYKDLEKAEIAAGKLTENQKMVNDALNTEMSNAKVIAKNQKGEVTYDGKTVPELKKDVYEKMGLYRESRGPKETIFINAMKDLLPTALKKINDLENKKRDLESKGKKLSADEEKDLTSKKAEVRPFVDDPLFDYYFKSYKQYFADGGRAGFAMGTPNPKQAMQQRQPNVQQTVVNQNNQAVPLKPVNNLGFSELRDRLPKEITDDIVMLISKSEEALQEFAYIRTQKDVNDFNVKYGVNLVLPATQNN
jgi:hypothetical protein